MNAADFLTIGLFVILVTIVFIMSYQNRGLKVKVKRLEREKVNNEIDENENNKSDIDALNDFNES